MRKYFAEHLIPNDEVLRIFEGEDGAGNPLTLEGFLVEAVKVDHTDTMRLKVEPSRPRWPHCPDPDAHPASPAGTVYVGIGPAVADRKFRITWTETTDHVAVVDAATLADLVGYHDVGELADAIDAADGVGFIDLAGIHEALDEADLDDDLVGRRREDVEVADSDAG